MFELREARRKTNSVGWEAELLQRPGTLEGFSVIFLYLL